jgi:hypothetical protein
LAFGFLAFRVEVGFRAFNVVIVIVAVARSDACTPPTFVAELFDSGAL